MMRLAVAVCFLLTVCVGSISGYQHGSLSPSTECPPDDEECIQGSGSGSGDGTPDPQSPSPDHQSTTIVTSPTTPTSSVQQHEDTSSPTTITTTPQASSQSGSHSPSTQCPPDDEDCMQGSPTSVTVDGTSDLQSPGPDHQSTTILTSPPTHTSGVRHTEGPAATHSPGIDKTSHNNNGNNQNNKEEDTPGADSNETDDTVGIAIAVSLGSVFFILTVIAINVIYAKTGRSPFQPPPSGASPTAGASRGATPNHKRTTEV